MPVSDKHGEAAQQVFYPSFNGGLDLTVPPESLPSNELKAAMNVEFSRLTGGMRVRGGLVWSGRFDGAVGDVAPVPGKRGFLVRERGSRKVWFFTWSCIWPVEGELAGDGDMSAAAWGEPGEMVVATGGKLQRFEPYGAGGLPSLRDIEGSPEECRLAFVRSGRVGVVDGPDTLRFSWVGDCEQWDNDPDDESTGQFIEIGYKDGMDINAIVPLSKDLIVFKCPKDEPDKGVVWRLTGDFPEWWPLEAAHDTGTFSQRTVQAVGNDVFYLSPLGLATLGTVTQYGEVRTAWPDRKVAPTLTRLLRDTAQLWNVPVKEQLWVLPAEGEEDIWAFDYGLGIWTQLHFPQVPVYAAGVDKSLYVFIGSDLYHVNDWYTQDEMRGQGQTPIRARLQMGTLLRGRQTLIKAAFASFSIEPEGRAELILQKFRMPFVAGGKPDYIYDAPNDAQWASEDDDPLFPPGNVLTSRRRCIVRDWAVAPEVEIEGGGCSLSTMGLEVVEV